MNLAELSAVVSDEAKAFEMIERLRWPDGPVCPHCGATDRISRLEGVRSKPSKKHPKGEVRYGLWKCYHCRKQFTVRVGSIFEDSPIPLGKWILAIHLMCSSKKGISSNQLKRELGVSYQTAWFLTHRIRLAMTQEPLKSKLGGGGGIVEIDETYVGGKRKNLPLRKRRYIGTGMVQKMTVMTLIDRKGDARTFHIPAADQATLQPIAKAMIEGTAHIMTDTHGGYAGLDKHFASHGTVNHQKDEYVRGIIHTNFSESYHSLLKRGIVGAFHHVSAKHLHRYLREFEFRWNSRKISDGARTEAAIKATEGKRLTYKPLTKPRKGTISQFFPD